MKRTSIRFCGVGGQGIILSSVLLGEAAVTREGLYAAQSQSYGSEARGGQCQSEVVLSGEPIGTPTSTENDILVAMFQTAYDSHKNQVKRGGTLFVDGGLVTNLGDVDPSVTVWKVPATESAIRMGSRMAGNMVMLGFVQEKTKLVSRESILAAMADSIKEKFVPINTKAFDEGVRLAREATGE
jgi:2-oxoglutarate ferredoxin oxidoreductase subunit gamma